MPPTFAFWIDPRLVSGPGILNFESADAVVLDFLAEAFMTFFTPEITDVGSRAPTGFIGDSGSLTTVIYRTSAGEHFAGSFSVSVRGEQVVGFDDQDEEIIDGRSGFISGRFDVRIQKD